MSNFEGQRRPVTTISTETQKMSATDGSHLGGDRSCSRSHGTLPPEDGVQLQQTVTELSGRTSSPISNYWHHKIATV